MNTKLHLIFSFLFISFCGYSQKLSLNDLTNLCSKAKWEDINQTLITKGWIYYNSEKGSTDRYNTIAWSFNKNEYSEAAQGWFYLYTYEDFPNKIRYNIFNIESFTAIQLSLASNGYSLTSSVIEDNQLVSLYTNANFKLEITTERRKKEENNDEAITSYTITIIRKSGIYDPENGFKKEYFPEGQIKMEYTLKGGKLNGPYKAYLENGEKKIIGNYSDGQKNGYFKEFDEFGDIETEYSMKNGKLDGIMKSYYTDNDSGTLKQIGTYLLGKANGNFIEFSADGTKESEYSMKDGEFDGILKTYHANGKIKKIGNFVSGKATGNFMQYTEDGFKEVEYTMQNGLKNGKMTVFENAKISYTVNYKNDKRSGNYIAYFYNVNNDLIQKYTGEYLNDEKSGIWKTFIVEYGKDKLTNLSTYAGDKKNGEFQEISGDSLILGSYTDNLLDGEYKIYLDQSKKYNSRMKIIDTSNLMLITEGHYYQNSAAGHWKYYDHRNISSEGEYWGGKMYGEWKFYYPKNMEKYGIIIFNPGELYLVENYLNGVLNGVSTRYSYLIEEKYACSNKDQEVTDSCTRLVVGKVLETKYYKDGELNGAFEMRDSANKLRAKGEYLNGMKNGQWTESNVGKSDNGQNKYIYENGLYKRDIRIGEWTRYHDIINYKTSATFNYIAGELHGAYTEWDINGNLKEKKQFINGRLNELITYDTLGVKALNKYEIYNVDDSSFKCRRTSYYEGGEASQEYWLKKLFDINHNLFEFMFFYQTGKSSTGEYGYRDGEYKKINLKGEPLVVGTFYKQNKNGVWQEYDYSQGIRIETNYYANILLDEKYFLILNSTLYSGKYVYLDTENNVKEERKIKNGRRNGKTIYKNIITKKTLLKENYKDGKLIKK